MQRVVDARVARKHDCVGILALASDLVRRDVGEINLTGVEGDERRGGIFEVTAQDFSELRLAAPVVVEGNQLGRHTGSPLYPLERACPDLRGLPVLSFLHAFRRDLPDRVLGEDE